MTSYSDVTFSRPPKPSLIVAEMNSISGKPPSLNLERRKTRDVLLPTTFLAGRFIYFANEEVRVSANAIRVRITEEMSLYIHNNFLATSYIF
ncbi:hypothetical protein LAZ67_8002139 [Cordylochernes scorpioides]|uniref:Uncharacterized protein n=1 Tax=Cordylochernes scorpioides TaxID=51811 RepID=A0ABY6KSA4_9ARAC|nr:hypothetical protein LAZ67_8002139 [Cordylochernes scorpioides]